MNSATPIGDDQMIGMLTILFFQAAVFVVAFALGWVLRGDVEKKLRRSQ